MHKGEKTMATKKTTKKTTVNAPAKKVAKASAKKRDSTAAFQKRIAELEEQVKAISEEKGKLLEIFTNLRIKQDAMLGQILKGLYLVGIDPDVIGRKCSQMFSKRVVAD